MFFPCALNIVSHKKRSGAIADYNMPVISSQHVRQKLSVRKAPRRLIPKIKSLFHFVFITKNDRTESIPVRQHLIFPAVQLLPVCFLPGSDCPRHQLYQADSFPRARRGDGQ